MLDDLINKYKYLSKQIKIIILILFSGISGYYSYTENWEIKEIELETLVASEEKLDEELKPLANIQSLAVLEAQRKKATEDLASLYELLPKDKEIDKLLAIFNDTAKEVGIKIKEISPNEIKNNSSQNNNMSKTNPPPTTNNPSQQAENNDFIIKYPIKTIVEGSYVQIGSFLDKILGISRIIKIEKLNIIILTDTKKEEKTINLKAEINFITYLQSDMGLKFDSQIKAPKKIKTDNTQTMPNTLSAKSEGGEE